MTVRSWVRKLFARTPRTLRNAPARFQPTLETRSAVLDVFQRKGYLPDGR